MQLQGPAEARRDEAQAHARLATALGRERPDLVVRTHTGSPLVTILLGLVGGVCLLFGSLFALAPFAFGEPTSGDPVDPPAFLLIGGFFLAAGAITLWNLARIRALAGPWIALAPSGVHVLDARGVRRIPWTRFSGDVRVRRGLAGAGTVWLAKRPGGPADGAGLGSRRRLGIASGRVREVESVVRARLVARGPGD